MKQIKQKIDTVGSPSPIEVIQADGQFAFTTWVRAQCVFGPTQLMNYTFVPLHLRLLVLQTAGFCESFLWLDDTSLQKGWNIYLSWANESSNRYFEDGLHSPID
jgi:protein Mpv17